MYHYQASKLKPHSVFSTEILVTLVKVTIDSYCCLSPVLKNMVWQLWMLLNQHYTGLMGLKHSDFAQSLSGFVHKLLFCCFVFWMH